MCALALVLAGLVLAACGSRSADQTRTARVAVRPGDVGKEVALAVMARVCGLHFKECDVAVPGGTMYAGYVGAVFHSDRLGFGVAVLRRTGGRWRVVDAGTRRVHCGAAPREFRRALLRSMDEQSVAQALAPDCRPGEKPR